jgi:hypothetical protein
MLDFCLRPGKIEGQKMLDFVLKAAINFLEWHVSIQARSQSLEFKPFLIGHIQYVGVKRNNSVYVPNYQFILFIIKYITTFKYHRSFHILARYMTFRESSSYHQNQGISQISLNVEYSQ